MRIPSNIPLGTYIEDLIRNDKLFLFYYSDEWLKLREFVMEQNHHECANCRKKGKVTRANCVHHVNHVRNRPDLALSLYYTDKHGNRKENLVPLCNACHNKEHPEKFAKRYNNGERFMNKERW